MPDKHIMSQCAMLDDLVMFWDSEDGVVWVPSTIAAARAIPISEEMIEAGYETLREFLPDVTDGEKPAFVKKVLRQIYGRMATASRTRK